jgi:3'-phosphoadenosine 5'-phosphosulfate (PAPS) 3'-phosphatase
LLIQHIRASGQLHVIDKAASGATDGVVIDPCTMADVMAQRLIAGNLRQLFPALCVRGEEDEDEQNPHHAVVTQVHFWF